MKIRTLLAALSFLAICLGGHAQESTKTNKPDLPPGPLVQKRAPDLAKWLVTLIITNPVPAVGQSVLPPLVTTTQVTKTGSVIRVDYSPPSRELWTVWCRGNIQVVLWPDGKSIGPVARPMDADAINPLFFDFSKNDFNGFEWLTPANYQEVSTYLGKKCILFRDISKVEIPGSASLARIRTAAVDFETRLPVELVDERGKTTYEFMTPPATPQSLPANVESYLKEQEKIQIGLAKKPAKPF